GGSVLAQPGVDVVCRLAAPVAREHGWDQAHLQLLVASPIRGRAVGGGLAIARYALKSATLRSASSGSEAVASRSFAGGSSGHDGRSVSAPRRRARSA